MRIFQLPDTSDILQVIRYNHIAKPQVTSNPGDKIPAIYDQMATSAQKTSTSAAADSVMTTAVPSGYIYHVQNVLLYYSATKAGRLWTLSLYYNGTYSTMYGVDTFPTSGNLYIPLNLYLVTGASLWYAIWNSENGATFSVTMVGVSMRVST